jgi:PAS domain S-box-containing protein
VHVDIAGSASAALDVLSTQKYDAIVSDYQMPEMNGIEFLKLLREGNDNTPFILFTGKGREEIVIEALKNGADFYLQKGTDLKSQFAELIHIINQLVTKRRSENALKESEERYRTFAQDFKGIAFRGDLDHNPSFLHGAVEVITGYTENDLVTGRMKWSELVLPDDMPKLLDRSDKLRETPGLSLDREYRIRRKDGKVRWVREVLSNVVDASGTVQVVEGVIHDITDKKLADDVITHNLEHFKALIESVADIIAVIDASGRIRYVSPSVTRTLGYEASEVMDALVLDLMHPDDVAFFAEMILKVFKKELVQPFIDCRIRAKNGSWIVLELTGKLSEDFDQGPRIIVNARDATEHRRIQDALISSERKFREFVERTCDGIAIVQDLKFKYANSRLAEIGGYAVEDILGKPFTDYIWPDELPKVAERYRKRIAGEPVPSVYETMLRRKDGTRLHVEFNAALIEYEGKPADFVIVHDITERKQAEEALRESEERYRTIFENTGTATIIIEDDMTISPANREFAKLTGYSKEEIDGKMKSTDFVSEEHLQKIRDYHQIRRTTPGAAPNKYEVQIRNKNGDIKDAVLTIDVIPGTKRSVASVSNVTERRQIEKEVEKKMAEQRMLLDNIDAMVWSTTDPETFGTVNRARAEFIGKEKEELEGRKLREVIPIEEECQVFITSNREVFEKKKTINIEEWITAANGERRLVSVTKTPMFDENGNVKFVVSTGIDITETRKKEEELKLATNKLNLCGSLLRHDIRNQLSVITGHSKLAMDDIKDPRVARHVERIEGATSAINKALAFAKNYQDMGTKAPVWNDPNNSLKEALVGLDLRDIAVEADLSKMEIFADPMLDRVFHNLIDNACKHGNGVKTVRIHYERSDDGLRLICEDDGIGVPEDKKERMFSGGHGLQMVRDILEITGMTISEKGEYGKGASFEINIPTGKFRFLNQDP